MEHITLEILTIVAILVGPIAAVQITQLLERRRQRKGVKEQIFKTLMRTRASGVHPDRVEALNMIDVAFHGTNKRDQKVVATWKRYLDALNSPEDTTILQRRYDVFFELLGNLSDAVGYRFSEKELQKSSYIPQAHVDADHDQFLLRKGMLALLNGESSISVKVSDQTK